MKKIVEIFSIVLIFITVLCTVTTTFVYAQPAIPTANEYEPQEEDVPTKFTNMIGTIATIIQAIGIVLSVIVIVMLGIKYTIVIYLNILVFQKDILLKMYRRYLIL